MSGENGRKGGSVRSESMTVGVRVMEREGDTDYTEFDVELDCGAVALVSQEEFGVEWDGEDTRPAQWLAHRVAKLYAAMEDGKIFVGLVKEERTGKLGACLVVNYGEGNNENGTAYHMLGEPLAVIGVKETELASDYFPVGGRKVRSEKE